jgi:predicted RecB family nuclease
VEVGFGLTRLPEPNDGDIFLDLEGDPFVGEHDLEYLFGYLFADENGTAYRTDWAFTRAEEKQAFESFVDFVMVRWAASPDLHIYHYAPYEPAALKRLMGRYATREEEIDRMLRAGLFVDLRRMQSPRHRQGLRVLTLSQPQTATSGLRGGISPAACNRVSKQPKLIRSLTRN